MNKILPLKRFGQNYLVDRNILLKIIEEIQPKFQDEIVEIGPGLGALTKELLSGTQNLTVVEIDKRVIEDLEQSFPGLDIVNGDFLEYDLEQRFQKKNKLLRVVGNIPYNITSPVLFKLIENIKYVQDAVFMIQLEVAQRITAKKGNKNYSILSVILNNFANVRLCFKVSPNVFIPKPKVTSAVIHISFNNDKNNPEFNKLFINTVKACFGNRRKTLKNSLNNSIFAQYNFTESGIDLTKRAEQLDIEEFIILTNYLWTKIHNKEGITY